MDLLTKIRGEIDLRLRELRPLLEEYERLLSEADEVGAQIGGSTGRRRSTAKGPRPASRRNGAAPARAGRAPRGAGQEAIVAALEHGSHTVSELAVVTAMSGPSIRQGLRRLLGAGTVTRAKREGKTAYTLSSPRR
ncbi:MAG TPA: helix-turn-helix domain-containing protein [Solirubrobacteraceae bacterium]|jgi:DNA-binding transcriptional ArsR family regulator|nr:helix-turn-helix domain-containing protein [Solirubrobacteraceae bacterium]